MDFGLSKTSAGLVIRARAIECLVMDGKRVVSTAQVPIEGEEPRHLTEALQQVLAQAGLKARRLAVSVENPGVLFRSFTLPVLPKPEWDAAVQFEARRYIPFKTEALIWDYHAVLSSATKRIEVVFAAIPREVFGVLQEALAAAGVHPAVIEPRSLSLARLVAPAKGGSSTDAVCLVDVEPDVAHLAIVKDGLPHLTRDISLLPRRTDLPAPDPSGAGQPPAPADQRAEQLLSELNVSIDFFVREYPSTRMSRVVLFGETALIKPWCQRLTGRLACPVESGDGLLAERGLGALEPSFASAAGLLQERRAGGGAALDFLKRSLAQAHAPPRPLVAGKTLAARLVNSLNPLQLAGCGALVIGCLVLFWVAGSLRVGAARRHLQALVASRQDVASELSGLSGDALVPINAQATAQLALLRQVMDRRVSMAAKLDALAHALPDGVWLTGLTFEDALDPETGMGRPHLLIQGACLLGDSGKELQAIQAFEQQVQQDPRFLEGFSAAQLDQISVEPNPLHQYTYRTFQLNCASGRQL